MDRRHQKSTQPLRVSVRGLSGSFAELRRPDGLRRAVDLLALYKVNVRYLHLTDDQSWRLPVGRPAESRLADDAFYSAEDLLTLAA